MSLAPIVDSILRSRIFDTTTTTNTTTTTTNTTTTTTNTSTILELDVRGSIQREVEILLKF